MIASILSAIVLAVGVFRPPAVVPDSISLSYCYEKAYDNYPAGEKIALQQKITDLNVKIAQSGYYPELQLNGKASYQSEVTEFEIPGASGPPAVSKDQYEASLGINQSIYNRGMVGIRKDLERARGEQDMNATRVELHQVRSQVDQVYFGILLSQQQGKSNELLMQNLRKQLKTIRARVSSGVLLPSQQHILEAEFLKAEQDSVSIQGNVRAGYRMLSEIVGIEINPETSLEIPNYRIDYRKMQPQRPEYDLFESNRELLEHQKKLNQTKKLPGITAFGTAAYGRPGLNFLNDDFHDYFIVGVRLRWNIRDLLNADRENEVLQISQQKVDRDEQAFTRQMEASLDRIEERIASIRESMERDEEIITLRTKVVEESASQLENGVITATEYVTELNHASRARLSLLLNKIRLSHAQAEYLTLLGIDR